MLDVLVVCVGSRGDVQPYVVLAQALNAAGASCAVAAHPEFEGFVRDAGCQFEVVTHSLPEALLKSDAGKQMREGKGGFAAARGFLLPLFKEYFRDVLVLTERLKPRILLLTLMPYLAGGFRVTDVLQQRRQQQQTQQNPHQEGVETSQEMAAVPDVTVMAAFTVPVHPTSAFLPGSAGLGFTAPWKLLNRFAWWLSYKLMDYVLYRPAAVQLAAEYNLPDVVTWPDYEQQHKPQSLYCYSPALLPRPDDWPPNIHVVGPWLPQGSFTCEPGGTDSIVHSAGSTPPQQQHAAEELHEDVLNFISAARQARQHVLYITLGSMLGCMFEKQEAERMLAVIAEAVQLLQEHQPCCAIIQCEAGLSTCAASESTRTPAAVSTNSEASTTTSAAPLLWWSAPLPHSLLLPLVDLVVHHGGMGTTHSTLAAGVPALIVPVAQASDQPFWANVVHQRNLGRMCKVPATKLTALQLATEVKETLSELDRLKQAVTEFLQVMRKQDGTQTAVKLVQQVLDETRPG